MHGAINMKMLIIKYTTTLRLVLAIKHKGIKLVVFRIGHQNYFFLPSVLLLFTDLSQLPLLK